MVVNVAPFGQNLRIVASSHPLSGMVTFCFLAAFFALSKTSGHPSAVQEYLPAKGTTTLPTSCIARICRTNNHEELVLTKKAQNEKYE